MSRRAARRRRKAAFAHTAQTSVWREHVCKELTRLTPRAHQLGVNLSPIIWSGPLRVRRDDIRAIEVAIALDDAECLRGVVEAIVGRR